MRGRSSKRRGTKSRTKAAGKSRAKTSGTRTRKTARTPARKKAVRTRPAPARKKAAAKKAPTAKTRAKPSRRRPTSDVPGEGNYTASRRFRRGQTEFVRRNRDKIPSLGEEAEAALEGEEGATLERAEERARARGHSPGEER